MVQNMVTRISLNSIVLLNYTQTYTIYRNVNL